MASFHGGWSLAACLGALLGFIMIVCNIPPFMHFTISALIILCIILSGRKYLQEDKVRQFEEVETVKVKKSLNYDIAAGKNYEFTFEYTIEDIDDNIKSIFNNTNLVSIIETNKTGLDQVQDPIN